MAAPFYAEFFSWRWTILLAVPFFLYSLVSRQRIIRPPWAILPMFLLLGLHAAALVFTTTPFADQVIKDLLIASFLLFVFILSDKNMLAGFFCVLIPLALVTAILGLLKAALLDRGYLLGFILDGCSNYPAGSALCVNYNNLGFMWLVAALGCIRTRFWWVIPILIAAGALSSSRRFVILAMFLPFLWVALQGWYAAAKAILSVFLSIFLVNIASDPDSFEKYRFGSEPYKVVSLTGLGAILFPIDRATPESKLSTMLIPINRATPDAMLGTMADGTIGTASRLEFWTLGASMISWIPHGWSYHEVFACRFSACTEFHYPHMTIISEGLIGGALFALVAIGFFAWPFLQILLDRQLFPVFLFFFAVPYALISGDTVLSLPACISCMLVALSVARARGMNFRQH